MCCVCERKVRVLSPGAQGLPQPVHARHAGHQVQDRQNRIQLPAGLVRPRGVLSLTLCTTLRCSNLGNHVVVGALVVAATRLTSSTSTSSLLRVLVLVVIVVFCNCLSLSLTLIHSLTHSHTHNTHTHAHTRTHTHIHNTQTHTHTHIGVAAREL